MRRLLQRQVATSPRLKYEACRSRTLSEQRKSKNMKKNPKQVIPIKISEETDGALCVSGTERPPVVLCSAAAVLRSDER